MPKRIQLSRKRGFKLPDGVIVCTRPGPRGNPFKVGDKEPVHGYAMSAEDAVFAFRIIAENSSRSGDYARHALSYYGRLGYWPDFNMTARLMRDHDLACWCPLDEPCHVDVWLEIANR